MNARRARGPTAHTTDAGQRPALDQSIDGKSVRSEARRRDAVSVQSRLDRDRSDSGHRIDQRLTAPITEAQQQARQAGSQRSGMELTTVAAPVEWAIASGVQPETEGFADDLGAEDGVWVGERHFQAITGGAAVGVDYRLADPAPDIHRPELLGATATRPNREALPGVDQLGVLDASGKLVAVVGIRHFAARQQEAHPIESASPAVEGPQNGHAFHGAGLRALEDNGARLRLDRLTPKRDGAPERRRLRARP